MKKLNLLLAIMIMAAVAVGQSVGINSDGSAPDASAMLDVSSTSKGFLAPRMTAFQRGSISSPVTGLLVYQTDGETGYYHYNGTAWVNSSSLWSSNLEGGIYYNTGNVGIGTTAPSALLTLKPSTNTDALRIVQDNEPNYGYSLQDDSNNGYLKLNRWSGGANTGTLVTVATDGRVGIGTTSPPSLLSVAGGAFTTNSGLTNTSSRPALGTSRIAGEIAGVGSSLASDDGFLRLSAGGGSASSVKSFIDLSGYSTVNDMLANIVFGTEGTERMRINNSGNVGIGTTTPSYPLDVVGASTINTHGVYFNHGGTTFNSATTDFNVTIKASNDIMAGGSIVATSDKRVKENITELHNSLELISRLRPVSYNKIDRVSYGNRLHYGFIAQEVEEVIPEAVNTGIGEVPVLKPFEIVSFEEGVEYTILVKNGDDIKEQKYTTGDVRPIGDIIVKSKTVDDFKSLSYDMIFTVAVDAIQEQQKEIEAFKAEIEALKSDNANLKAENNAVKSDVEALKSVVYGTAQVK